MPNQMDARFAARKSYSLKGRNFIAKIKCTGTAWEAVLYYESGKVQGVSFASEEDATRYIRAKNNNQRLVAVATVDGKTQPAYMDVEDAKEAMVSAAPRKFDPRIATVPGESTQQFSYTAEQIEKVNESILESYCERHASDFYSLNYNLTVLARALADQLQETPGVILNDGLISGVIAQLEANNMLVPRVIKRGSTAVSPYRRLSEVAQVVEQQYQLEQDAEARRRRSLQLSEQKALLESENENLRLGGSTIHQSATQSTQVTSRVNAGREISEDEKELRRQLNSGEISFEDLRAQEVARSKR